ncbi:glycosyltransferase [Acidimicrobiia bacterium]|nr:glycosyltransferase [Acidimicrobiia bacterium]
MIPKIIYRSWKTQNFHPKIDKQIKKMLKTNPDYEQIIYTDEQIRDYIKSNYDLEIYNAFESLTIMAAKVDFWRYLILYKKGGIYLDIDSNINSRISDFLAEEDNALITAETNPDLFVQWALFFVKDHPILERTIELVTQNIINNKYHNDIVNTTGPGVFTKALQDIHTNETGERINWNNVDQNYDKRFFINLNNKQYNYRLFGVDFNNHLSFKYKDTSYLYKDLNHWKKEETIKDLIQGKNLN